LHAFFCFPEGPGVFGVSTGGVAGAGAIWMGGGRRVMMRNKWRDAGNLVHFLPMWKISMEVLAGLPDDC